MSTTVHAALAKRFPSPEWATFFEVRDAAGFNARRSADVVAMNTWPSRGLSVHGVEVKVSRSDWLRELKDPAKSASVQRFCDRWWLAAGDDKVAKIEEVPEAWGLLVLRGKALVQVKEAPPLPAEPLTRGFVAMLLHKLGEALRALLALGSPYGLDKLEHAKREADRMSAQLASAIDVVRALGERSP